MANLTIDDLKQGRIYVIESRENIFICCFDRLQDIPEMGKKAVMDFFCIATSKSGRYAMRLMCDTCPLAIDVVSIREATDGEAYILFSMIREEMLRNETKRWRK